jgi:NAD(P)-dependent dehydrogenase (short-subunit alcohol dehydrogenase family)
MNKRSTVIITGASSGIGLALAEAFLERGDNVVGNAREGARLARAAERLGTEERLQLIAGDIGDPRTARALFAAATERFDGADVLVNNAGIFDAKPVTAYTDEDIDRLVRTNLLGVFYATREAALHMSQRGHGHIVNVTASIALQPTAKVPASIPIAIKGGINSMTRALAIELAEHSIKVSAVAPGIIDTPLYTPDMHDFLSTLQPAGHIGATSDIVEAVLYLSSAAFTTGVVLPVDGGMSAGTW